MEILKAKVLKGIIVEHQTSYIKVKGIGDTNQSVYIGQVAVKPIDITKGKFN
jgi:hypothetical protein